MRRSFILTSALAVSTAVLGACEAKPVAPNKPVPTPAPVTTANPAPSPVASPAGTPGKPGATPEVKKTDDKKTDDKKPVNKEIKLQGTPVKPA